MGDMVHGLRTSLALLASLVALLATGCNSGIYVRDGVTDGDRFSLPPHAYMSEDPVLQAWVAYGLARSVCQLEMGGPNPARNHAFGCELDARAALVTRWRELRDRVTEDPSDAAYLDALSATEFAGHLDEYVWHYLRRRGWQRPDNIDTDGFDRWRRANLERGHRPQTRIVGSWGYASTGD